MEESEDGCFSLLPEGCISAILSLTSPLDAVRAMSISYGFMSASQSDVVWENFLPPDYLQLLSRFVSPLLYSSKKDLYSRLSDSFILLDNGKLSFSLEKKSGKKCFMISARELSISWQDNSYFWEWMHVPESRFAEVVQLQVVCWLDLRGKIETQMLSYNTTYDAYLVFKLASSNLGLDLVKTYVRFVREIEEDEAVNQASEVCLLPHPPGPPLNNRRFPVERGDGWMEIKLGEFYNDGGDDGEVEMRLMEIEHLYLKSGLIVLGMEVRPKQVA